MATTGEAAHSTTTSRRSPAVAAAVAVLLAALGLLVVLAATGHTGADPTLPPSAAPPAPVSCDSRIDPSSVAQAEAPTKASLATDLDSIVLC